VLAPELLFAYGPVPGVELIPYFFALLAWIALALGALFLSPFTAAFRLLRRAFGAARPAQPIEAGPVPPAPVITPVPSTPVQPVEGPRDHG
jgi:hypothetical protein